MSALLNERFSSLLHRGAIFAIICHTYSESLDRSHSFGLCADHLTANMIGKGNAKGEVQVSPSFGITLAKKIILKFDCIIKVQSWLSLTSAPLFFLSLYRVNINIFGRFCICVLVFPCVSCVLSVCVL